MKEIAMALPIMDGVNHIIISKLFFFFFEIEKGKKVTVSAHIGKKLSNSEIESENLHNC